jgi:hypothetical protein
MSSCICAKRYDPASDTTITTVVGQCPEHGPQDQEIDFVRWYDPENGEVVNVDLTRLTDGSVMCCICFGYYKPDELWVDLDGVKWDMCISCGEC